MWLQDFYYTRFLPNSGVCVPTEIISLDVVDSVFDFAADLMIAYVWYPFLFTERKFRPNCFVSSLNLLITKKYTIGFHTTADFAKTQGSAEISGSMWRL